MSRYYEDVGVGYVDSGARIRAAETRRQRRRQARRAERQAIREHNTNVSKENLQNLKERIQRNPDAIDFNDGWYLESKEILQLHEFINQDGTNYAEKVGAKFLSSKLAQRKAYQLKSYSSMNNAEKKLQRAIDTQHELNAKITVLRCSRQWNAEVVLELLTNPQCPLHTTRAILKDKVLMDKLTPEMIQTVVDSIQNHNISSLTLADSALVGRFTAKQREVILTDVFKGEDVRYNSEKFYLENYKITKSLTSSEAKLILKTAGAERDITPLANLMASKDLLKTSDIQELLCTATDKYFIKEVINSNLTNSLTREEKKDILVNASDILLTQLLNSPKMLSSLSADDINDVVLSTNDNSKLWAVATNSNLQAQLNEGAVQHIFTNIKGQPDKLLQFANTNLTEKLDKKSVDLLFNKVQDMPSYAYKLRNSKLIDRASPEQITELFNNLKKTPQAIDTIVSCKLIQKLGKNDIQSVLEGLDQDPPLDNKILSAVVRSTAMSQVLDSMTIEQADKINKRIEGKRNGWDKRYNVFVAKDLTAKAQKEVNELLQDCPDQGIKDKITADFKSLSEEKILSTSNRTAKEEAHDITVYLETTQKKLTAIADYCDKQKVSKLELVKEAIQVAIGKIIPLKRFASWRSTEKTTNLTKKYKVYKMREVFKQASRETKNKVQKFSDRITRQRLAEQQKRINAGWAR